jgi:predicted CopG family antitoxin
MATADEQIRVSDRVRREIDRLRGEGESYNDVLGRVLDEDHAGNFYDGFGRWSDEDAECVRGERRKSKEKRKNGCRNGPRTLYEASRCDVSDLSWGETYAVDERTAATAGEIGGEVAAEDPYLDGLDGLIAAVGRELDAPVVSNDGDLTHDGIPKPSTSKSTASSLPVELRYRSIDTDTQHRIRTGRPADVSGYPCPTIESSSSHSRSRSSYFWTLPVAVVGNSATNSTRRTIL